MAGLPPALAAYMASKKGSGSGTSKNGPKVVDKTKQDDSKKNAKLPPFLAKGSKNQGPQKGVNPFATVTKGNAPAKKKQTAAQKKAALAAARKKAAASFGAADAKPNPFAKKGAKPNPFAGVDD